MNRKRRGTPELVARGIVAGVAGGLAASFVMSQFQAGLSKLMQRQEKGQESEKPRDLDNDATVKTASAISGTVFGHELTKREKEKAGPVVHYGFGAAVGGLYGVLAEIAPPLSSGWGLPFGAAVWLAADEVAVPLFGLSKNPKEYPASTHASALAAHLVYGLSTDIVRRLIGTTFDGDPRS